VAPQTLAQQVQEKAAQIAEASYFADEDGVVPMSPTRIAARIRNELQLEPAEERSLDAGIGIVLNSDGTPKFSNKELCVRVSLGEHVGDIFLSRRFVEALLEKFGAPSDSKLREMAEQTPNDLFFLFGKDLPVGDLARVASAVVHVPSDNRAPFIPVLIHLATSHSSVLIREACLQGLSKDRSSATYQLLKLLSTTDSSPFIRDLAKDILD